MEGAVAEIQGLVTNWVAALAALLPFGYAFSAGMVAAVNPCGFVMLPAYLSLYLGAHEATFAERSLLSRVLRALLVGISVSGGFVLLFGAVGLAVSAGGRYLMAAPPGGGLLSGRALVGGGAWPPPKKTFCGGACGRPAGGAPPPRP